MLPLLQVMGNGQEMTTNQMRNGVAERLSLSSEALSLLLPSGTQTVFSNRMGWARTYLFKAGLIQRPRRATYSISDSGKKVLLNPPASIDEDFLSSFDEFKQFIDKPQYNREKPIVSDGEKKLTPDEQIESGIKQIQRELKDEILARVKQLPPEGFEQLVLYLLVGMGYGGSISDVQGVARGADGGIDGVVNQDYLGLDRIYIQAKRWEGSVGSPVIQRFAGSLDEQGAKKGVVMTTSTFSQPALDSVNRIKDKRIILVDGQRMAELMLKHNIGASTKQSIVIQRLDEDFFLELEN
jgi:restriction system protein